MKITITENQLKTIIESAINSFNNIIPNIIEYVKGFGQKGKLPPVDKPLSDYYKTAMQTAYEWACESTDDVKRYGFAYFEHNFKVDVVNNFIFSKHGLIYVERSIDIDTSEGLDSLKYSSIGECWSWKKNNSKSYCADFSLTKNTIIQVILCGYVHPDSINWTETVYLNSYGMKNETEIRMNDNALVEISYIKVNGDVFRLGGSFLVNASADKYNKNKW